MLDFGTGPIKDVEKGVEFIQWNLRNGRSVYVHCKAGRGRSALVVAAYLVKYYKFNSKDALQWIKKYRSQAGFTEEDEKMKTLY